MTIRSRAGVLAANVLQIIFGKNKELAAKTLAGLGNLWQVGPGRKSNHGYRKSTLYHAMPGVTYKDMQPTYETYTPPRLPVFKGVRPGRSYRGARQNDAWARKDVGNTKPADRKRLMAEGRV